jgi:hypothetical protein
MFRKLIIIAILTLVYVVAYASDKPAQVTCTPNPNFPSVDDTFIFDYDNHQVRWKNAGGVWRALKIGDKIVMPVPSAEGHDVGAGLVLDIPTGDMFFIITEDGVRNQMPAATCK